MADLNQSSEGNSQEDGFMDIDQALGLPPELFSQDDALDQFPYGLNSETSYSGAGVNDRNWMSVGPDAFFDMVPHFDGAFCFPRLSFSTAPPHYNPPSHVHELRGYRTDPQPQAVSHGNSVALFGGASDQEWNVDFDRFNLQGTHDHTQIDLNGLGISHPPPRLEGGRHSTNLIDETTTTLIQSCVKLNPTTFFYKEKIEALATLTSLSYQTIEKVIRQLLEGGLPSQYRITSSSESSMTSPSTSQSWSASNCTLSSATTTQSQPSTITDIQQYHSFTQPNVLGSLEERPVLKQAARFLLGGRAEKCRPTSNRALLSRDEGKIYQCTFKCGSRFARKADMRRHEEEKNYPQEGWICDVDPVVSVEGVLACAYCRLQNPPTGHAPNEHGNRTPFCHEKGVDARGKIFTRKKRFIEHFKSFHPTLPIADYLITCHFVVRSKFPQWCGFCERSRNFHGSKVRSDHMADHFEHGLNMSQWREPVASGETADEDGDTDGDGDESNDDADDDVDEGSDRRNNGMHGRENQPKDGFSSGVRSQKGTGGANGSSSTQAQNGCNIHCLKRDPISMRRHERKPFAGDPRTNKALPFGNSRYTISLLSNPGKAHNARFWSALENGSASSRQVFLQKGESQTRQKGDIGARGSGLEENLRNARIRQRSHTFFVPISEINRLITLDSVCHELRVLYPDSLPETNANSADIIAKYAKRLFALLVSIGKGSTIIDFIEEGILDNSLPVGGASYSEARAFAQWTPRAVEDFDRDQWSFLAPVFDQVGWHYDFEDSVVLPFIDSDEYGLHRMTAGGYSEVWGVRIHPAHQRLLQPTTLLDKKPVVAIKRLHSTDRLDFEREAGILKKIAKKEHPHLIKLLTTYQKDGSYHLIFPYASENLRTYWRNEPYPEWDQEFVLWSLRQLTGLTSALQAIHNFRTQQTEDSSCRTPTRIFSRRFPKEAEELYGRHGDIKPENILWFPELGKPGVHQGGTFQITDFGLGRLHGRDSRSNVNPRTVVSTPTYEAPECALSNPVSRAYDMWSLGCVFLEYLTWMIRGSEMVDAFANARLAIGKDGFMNDRFYAVREDASGNANAFVQDTVLRWIAHLQSDDRCSGALRDLLDLVRDKLLVVNAKDRIPSTILLARLQGLVKRAEMDEAYLLMPASHYHSIGIVERGYEKKLACLLSRYPRMFRISAAPNAKNLLLNPPSGRTCASDPGTGIRTGHQLDLNMEINASCLPVYDRQSLTECTWCPVAEEGHVSPAGDHPQPGGRNLGPWTELVRRAGVRAIDQSHEWYSRQPDSDKYYRYPRSDYEGKYKQFCHYKKHIDKHLKPHRCGHRECEGSLLASAVGVLRHEREAHGMHAPQRFPYSFERCGRGKNKPFILGVARLPLEDRVEALLLAAEGGHEAVVNLLLENKADVTASISHKTALHLAAVWGHEATIKLSLKNGAALMSHRTALHLAAVGGHEAIVKLLLENGADVRAPVVYRYTTLPRLRQSAAAVAPPTKSVKPESLSSELANETVVAVHSLHGRQEKTWSHKGGVPWLRDLLPDKLPNARIMVWGYGTNTHSSDRVTAQSLYDHARALLSDLSLQKRLTNSQKRPTDTSGEEARSSPTKKPFTTPSESAILALHLAALRHKGIVDQLEYRGIMDGQRCTWRPEMLKNWVNITATCGGGRTAMNLAAYHNDHAVIIILPLERI